MTWLMVTEAATATAAWLRESWSWLLIPAIPAALFGAWWLWWRLPKRAVSRLPIPDVKARADVEDNFRKTTGQLLGGAAVLLGASLAYLQFHEQQQTTRLQSEQQQKAARELLVSNQVAKGFELLGNKEKDITLRLGGIYALEGVMNASEDYYRPVLEALCAFVRDHTKENTSADAPTTDVQAALAVIGRRHAIGKPVPDLSNVHIPKANLRGADLSDANLSDANLSGAHLSGANLHDTNLLDTDLSGAILIGTNLGDAYLTTKLSSADHHAKLSGANLTRAKLGGADLGDADLSGAELSRADLKGAVDLVQSQLDKACGTDVKLNSPLTIKPCQ